MSSLTASGWGIKIRMYLLLAVLFGIVYALVTAVSYYFGITNFIFYGFLAFGMLLLQYLLGPKIVEWSMRVKYVSEKEAPELHAMVEELARKAGLPKPRVGIAQIELPNAFAFGRWKSDGRICVTSGILKLLDKKELKAVLGHEVGHLKNKDVAIITLLSIIPMICWYLAWNFIFSGGNRENKGSTVLIGILAFVLYFVTNLLVLYASRIREYYADHISVELGNHPSALASALYKLVQGSARTPKAALKQVEGLKAFFANDPSQAAKELREISQVDLDGNGHIDTEELAFLQKSKIKVGYFDKVMELMNTHPNMLKRIKALSQLKAV